MIFMEQNGEKTGLCFSRRSPICNESAQIRNVGITIETRPDWTKKEHIDTILELGCDKSGDRVQSTYILYSQAYSAAYSCSKR